MANRFPASRFSMSISPLRETHSRGGTRLLFPSETVSTMAVVTRCEPDDSPARFDSWAAAILRRACYID